jgi:Protein of unknown function (DUF4232)
VNLRIAVAGLGFVALAAGCGSSSSGPPASQAGSTNSPVVTPTHHHRASATPSATPTPTVSPTPPATVTATVTSAPAVSRCLSSNLTISLGIGQGTAGTTYQVVVFTNHGSAVCELHGYPGVSFVTASGAQIGVPSSEDAGKIKTITLAASGGEANALLRQPDAGNFPPSACHVTTSDRLKVYPPGETVPLFVHDASQVCKTSAGRTGIGPVLAGNGG